MTVLNIPLATQDFANDGTKLRVTVAIQKAIERSFISHKMRRMTKAEVNRRFTLCFEGYRVMRNELGWSTTRCIDYLDRILRAALDGKPLDLNAQRRSAWFGQA